MKEQDEKIHYLKLYFWTFAYLKKYAWFIVLAVFFRMIFDAATIMVPKLIQVFIDSIGSRFSHKMNQNMPVYLGILVGIILISYMMFKTFEMIYAEWGTKEVQWAVYDKTRDMGVRYFDKAPVGEVLSLLSNNVISIYYLFSQYVPEMISIIISTLLALYMLCLSRSFILVGMVITSTFLVILCNVLAKGRIEKVGNEAADAAMKFNKNAYDSVEAVEEVRIFQATGWNKERVMKALDELLKRNTSMFLLGKGKSVMFYVCKLFTFGVYIFLCTTLVKAGRQSLGHCVADFIYLTMAFGSMERLEQMIITQDKHIYNVQKVYVFMEQKPESTQEGRKEKKIENGAIEFQKVSFGYSKEKTILNHVQFCIAPGEKVVLVGNSGEGKSTILKLLTACYPPTSGNVLIDGISIAEYEKEEIRNKLGIVLQDGYLFSMSIYDNIHFGNPEATKEEVQKAAFLAGAHEFIKELPDGYDTLLESRGERLSGGERQRILLARSILRKTKILLLDEVTANLDYALENKVITSLKQMKQTMIICAHRLSVIKKADRIMVLKDGEIVENGCYEELIQRNGYLANLISKGIVVDE